MAARIFVKLLVAILGLLVVAMIAVDLLGSRLAESSYVETLQRDLTDKALLLARLSCGDLSQQAVQSLARAVRGRLTLVAADGRVLADSEADPLHMENHRSRPEVFQALAGHPGSSIRLSPTVGVKFLYVAVPASTGALRLAVPLSEIERQVDAVRRRMLASTALAFLPAVLLAALFARLVSGKLGRIVEYAGELARGNFRARLAPAGNDELGQLGRKLNETGEKLQRMFEMLEREHAELEKLERIRKDFVINVSHELRTPLASIQGYTETLLDGALADPEHNVRFLAIIRQNAERLARLTADLITLSQVELKTRAFHFAYCDLGRLLADGVEAMRPLAARRSLTLSLEPVPAGAQAFCDPEALHQILGNLLDNAIKYTPEGGAVAVGARGLAESVEIYVRDTGIGIPAADLSRLFERFYRVDKARSREMGGTGLGLAIVKHLVRAQGGDVHVSSQPGKGSVFSFTLPIHETVTEEEAVVSPPRHHLVTGL